MLICVVGSGVLIGWPLVPFGVDDDELNINPPTPCQIGKRPPAPKPKRESAGHQGVAGGGYLWSHEVVSCRGVFVGDSAEARVGEEALDGPVGGWAVRPSWSAGSGISRCSEWHAPRGCVAAWSGWPCCRRSGPAVWRLCAAVSVVLRQPPRAPVWGSRRGSQRRFGRSSLADSAALLACQSHVSRRPTVARSPPSRLVRQQTQPQTRQSQPQPHA